MHKIGDYECSKSFFIWFTNEALVIFHNKSLSPLKKDINRNADISTDVLQSSSGQILTKKSEQKNLKNENSEKPFANHYDR